MDTVKKKRVCNFLGGRKNKVKTNSFNFAHIKSFAQAFSKACGSRAEPSSLSAESEIPQRSIRGRLGLGESTP